MSAFEEYREWVDDIEKRYDYGFKSTKVKYLDGSSFEDQYEKIFNMDDQITKQRNRYRTPFQLERDRILYSPLLIRLSEKTQLFTSEKGLKENRLTHTMKVVQIARSLGRGLKLNEDLIEAIAWGHDIGHPPFGHIGEEAINEWIREKVEEKNGWQQSLPLDSEEQHLLKRIQEKYKENFKKYFMFGNDPNESYFMHGRQSFRLLVFKRKPDMREHLRYTKPVMYGIWRHSVRNSPTDNEFKFEKKVKSDRGAENTAKEVKITLDGKEDNTLEAQVVRYADDIAWVIADLTEGVNQKLIDDTALSEIIDSTNVDIERLFYLLRNRKLDQLYTFFIFNFINYNLNELERKNKNPAEQNRKIILTFSKNIEEVFRVLKNLINKNVHQVYFMSRGNKINKERIKALCDWYFEHPDTFLDELKKMKERPSFPLQIPISERSGGEYTEHAFYEDLIKNDDVYRISAIVDFVSVLTDREVCKLSETMPD